METIKLLKNLKQIMRTIIHAIAWFSVKIQRLITQVARAIAQKDLYCIIIIVCMTIDIIYQ